MLRFVVGLGLLAGTLLGSSPIAQAQSPDQPPAEGRAVLGVLAVPLDQPALRAHLHLPDGQGLLIEDVAPQTPADEAGLRHYDILIQAGDQPLESVEQLSDIIRSHPGDRLKLRILRGGQEQEIEVTPRVEPIGHLPRLPALGTGPSPRRVRILGPGLADQGDQWPADLSVAVTKNGQEPAVIEIHRTGEDGKELHIKVDANSLDQVPEDVRVHVEGLLGRRRVLLQGLHSFWPQVNVDAAPPTTTPESGDDIADLKAEMQQMKAQLGELIEALEKQADGQD